VTSTSKKEIIEILSLRNKEQIELHKKASLKRNEVIGNNIFFRGLIEASNICKNDCFYCGIRQSNKNLMNYELSENEILEIAETINELGFSSIVIQSGERQNKEFTSYINNLIKKIKSSYPQMVITLSVGEQTEETYKEFYNSGAERYLLRIESSQKDLYEKIHPSDMSFDNRIKCLDSLKTIGFQVGTGVMIHLPEQGIDNLANDILFLRGLDIDMCGMGPYIPHEDAPLIHQNYDKSKAINLSLNMISALRLTMTDINIAATTALEALSPEGRKMGLNAGANIIMPQFSPEKTRVNYRLYDNKPIHTVDNKKLIEELKTLAESCKMNAAFNEPGNSLHFKKRGLPQSLKGTEKTLND